MKKTTFLLVALSSLILFASCGETKNQSVNESNTEEKQISEPEEITLYFTRHGKTMLNTLDLSQGWIDSPLTPAGVEVAEKLGKGLKKSNIKFDKVYSSDSGRARETAHLILDNNGQGNLDVSEDKRFREANFGSYEAKPNIEMAEAAAKELGISIEDMMKDKNAISKLSDALYEIDSKKDSSDMGWPAESSQQVKERLVAGAEDIIQTAKEEGTSQILVVFHGNSIMELLHELDPDAEITPLDNASISKVIYKDGKYKVESVNDTSYIE